MGRALRRLPGLAAAAAAASAVAGLVGRPSGEPVRVVTPRGAPATLAGHGVYRHDTVFTAAGNVASDAVVVSLAVPLVLRSWLQHRAGSPRGTLLMTGGLGYLLYVYANYSLGVAYNPLFLVYVTAASTALFGLVGGLRHVDRAALAAVAADPAVPHRALAGFLLASAAVTAVVWLQPLLQAMERGTAPALLDVYTTPVTYALDLGVIVPAAALAGLLVLRRDPLGYLLAVPLLVTIALLLPTIAVSTALQRSAGISFSVPEALGPIAGFGVLGVVGSRLLARVLGAVPAGPTALRRRSLVRQRPSAVSRGSATPGAWSRTASEEETS